MSAPDDEKPLSVNTGKHIALDRVDRMEKERSGGSGILSDATLKKWHGLLEGLTGSDPISPFSGAGLTDEGLEAVHDMNMMVLEWEAQNPTASFIERQEAINRIGGIIRQRIELDPGMTIGGRYVPEAEKAALQVAKEKGRQLGGLRDKTMKRNEAIQRKANAEAAKLIKIIGPLREAGQTLATIAGTLNDMKVETSRGGTWTPMQVKRVLERVSQSTLAGS